MVAWVLNLDAEDELSHPGAHTPTAAMTARIEGLLPRLSGLMRPGDVVLWPGSGTDCSGQLGSAWCPTRWALLQMERAGVTLPRAPPMEVLRRVNHRRFSAELGQSLPGAGYFVELEALLAVISSPAAASEENCWLIKRPFGFAGRGRKKLRAGEVSAADRSWLEASLRSGEGLQVEPWVSRSLDCALHGWLAEDGTCTLGVPTIQQLDATGAWQASVVAPPGALRDVEIDLLRQEASRTAQALHGAGYFGPFGIDGFRWGAGQFQPRCEINARYSMGWATGNSGPLPDPLPRGGEGGSCR